MKTITVELSVDSCNKAIEELKKYQKEIKPKLDEVCKRLAGIGVQEASARARGGKEGNDDVAFSVEKIDNGYKLVMSGEDVYFVEFGTGDQVNAHYDTSVPVAYGSWSVEHSQMLWNKGFWYYDKVRYTGTPAYMPMYYAERKMREEAPRIVKEVFG